MIYAELEDLTFEHNTFLEFLKAFEKAPPGRETIAELGYFLANLHHAKEEKFLFPLLFGSKSLEIGGPKCMTFFTPRVIGGLGWQDPFAALRATLGFTGPAPDELNEFRARVFHENSMLRIPIEDHLIEGRVDRALANIESGNEYDRLLSLKLDLLKDHIRREEECLFVLLKRTLTKEQKFSYAENAMEFDLVHKTAGRIKNLCEKILGN